jgi:hypothetical protein
MPTVSPPPAFRNDYGDASIKIASSLSLKELRLEFFPLTKPLKLTL